MHDHLKPSSSLLLLLSFFFISGTTVKTPPGPASQKVWNDGMQSTLAFAKSWNDEATHTPAQRLVDCPFSASRIDGMSDSFGLCESQRSASREWAIFLVQVGIPQGPALFSACGFHHFLSLYISGTTVRTPPGPASQKVWNDGMYDARSPETLLFSPSSLFFFLYFRHHCKNAAGSGVSKSVE